MNNNKDLCQKLIDTDSTYILGWGDKVFEVILFDLGRVVVDLGESPIPKCWLRDKQAISIKDWFSSPISRQFEKGEISEKQFIHQLKQDFALDKSEQEIADAFTAWPLKVYSRLPEVLAQLREQHHLAVLSNTNELHFPRLINEFNIAEYFDTLFLSHHMHMAKPDLCAFQHVLDVLQVAPEKVLYLDDIEENVQAAKKLGMTSVQVCGEAEVIQVLKGYKLIE